MTAEMNRHGSMRQQGLSSRLDRESTYLHISPEMAKASTRLIIPIERIVSRIYVIRGENVMLDSDLAGLYGVTTGNLNLAVRRNRRRFPKDFVFQLSAKELKLCSCKMQ